ncbi:basal body-orientation factor 1-like [Gigantopelta aegis]|uniref:basal body-orientation factor 1-like n=1 Tax=Gigantopelta aegis TaxID=1735272 RepID=UPI001B88DC65|nr:basal body-orientation factor 1-like [Gigantopelta aegis]
MPKKAKKGKGKGKGKKGKKGAKKSKKAESLFAIAAANSKVWETRLGISERAKQEFRESAKKLMLENDALQTQMINTEQDTIDVITYLKKQDQEKDLKLERLQQQIQENKKEHRKEKETICEDFSKQINELEEKLAQKGREVEMMQAELKLVKEFRRKRGQMQKELDEIKEAMHTANREHKTTLTQMEQKFFEEKMRLQQEANQKIAELAQKAHTEAIANLDETTKSVYKENVRQAEALNYHMKEGEMLKNEVKKLQEENEMLNELKKTNDLMIQEKVIQTKQQKETIKKLQEKVQTLEKSLSHVVREFESEKDSLIMKASIENEASKVEIRQLQRVIEMKSKEMSRVKRLAKNILDQRTELERFFLDSLEQVKAEISANQSQYCHDAQVAYHHRMLAAHAGKGEYPKIRTFVKSESSTNNVYKDLEAAERLYNVGGKVDISDLTLEQKERVLRYLFAKMNGANTGQSPPTKQERHLSITEGEETSPDRTFLTQATVSDNFSKHPVIPNIGTSSTLDEPLAV